MVCDAPQAAEKMMKKAADTNNMNLRPRMSLNLANITMTPVNLISVLIKLKLARMEP
jgi:hypothetical protein